MSTWMSTKHVTLSLPQVTLNSPITLLLSLHLYFQWVTPPCKQSLRPKLGSHPCLYCSVTPDLMPTINCQALVNLPSESHLPQIISPLPMDATLFTSTPQSTGHAEPSECSSECSLITALPCLRAFVVSCCPPDSAGLCLPLQPHFLLLLTILCKPCGEYGSYLGSMGQPCGSYLGRPIIDFPDKIYLRMEEGAGNNYSGTVREN